MRTHNICFHGQIRKILTRYPLLSVARHCVFVLPQDEKGNFNFDIDNVEHTETGKKVRTVE